MNGKLLGKNEEKSLLAEEINILVPLVKKGISSYTNLLNKKQAYVRLKSETLADSLKAALIAKI